MQIDTKNGGNTAYSFRVSFDGKVFVVMAYNAQDACIQGVIKFRNYYFEQHDMEPDGSLMFPEFVEPNINSKVTIQTKVGK